MGYHGQSWLSKVLPEVVGYNPDMEENEWNKLIVMLKQRSAIQTENAVAQLLAGNDPGDNQNRLILDLYRERLRRDELIITVNLGSFQFLRWTLLVAARGTLFESPNYHRRTNFDRLRWVYRSVDTSKIPIPAGTASSDAQVRMSESIFGDQGVLGTEIILREALEFERDEGITEYEAATSKSIPIAANLSLQTRWITDVGGERKAKSCENCECILAPVLAGEGTHSIAIQGPDEAIPTSLSPGKIAIRDLVGSGRLPPKIMSSSSLGEVDNDNTQDSKKDGSKSIVSMLIRYWSSQLVLARKRGKYDDAALLSSAVNHLVSHLRDEASPENEKSAVSNLIYEILVDMIARRKFHERLQAHFRSTRQLKRDIRAYLSELDTRQVYLEEYLHSLRYGQSEQQNRRVVAMEARTSLRKVTCLGISCCVHGKLTDPMLVSSVNK